jgi:hypothetical protein
MATAGNTSDFFTGTWRFSHAESRWFDRAPLEWSQAIDVSDDGVRVIETIVPVDGVPTRHTVDAKFDGTEYPVRGSSAIDTIAYARPEAFRIEGTARKGGRVAFREVVAVCPDRDTLTMTVSLQGRDGRSVEGVAVFRRDSPGKPAAV